MLMLEPTTFSQRFPFPLPLILLTQTSVASWLQLVVGLVAMRIFPPIRVCHWASIDVWPDRCSAQKQASLCVAVARRLIR